MSNLSKVKLIAAVAKDAGITQDSARKALDAMWSHVVETLRAGGRVEIRDVGSFQKKTRAERKGKNPQNGEPITIPAKTYIHFKSSENLNVSIL